MMMELIPPPLGDGPIFTVTDLKQFTYCPRVVFYTYCLPLLRPETFKMQESQQAHQEERVRERRRSLSTYGLPEGERAFDVPLASAALGLRGQADMVIGLPDEVIPVDFKQTRGRAGAHFRLQLAAYGLMLAEMTGMPVRRGFIYAIALRQAEEIALDGRAASRVARQTEAMRCMVEVESPPDPPARRARCVACEFRRFCNDL